MESVSEVWLPVAGRFFGWPYEVSNLGRIKSLNTNVNGKYGQIRSTNINKYGYEAIGMSFNMQQVSTVVHKLVAEAFLGDRPHKADVNHMDGNKANNRLDNLEYVTRKENCRHAFAIGLAVACKGSKNPNSILNELDIIGIRKLLRSKAMKHHEIAFMFGVGRSTIGEVARRRIWRHVA